MSENEPGITPESPPDQEIWRVKHQLDILHSELASLYRTKSNNGKLIRLLWQKIEEKELFLLLNGVDPTS